MSSRHWNVVLDGCDCRQIVDASDGRVIATLGAQSTMGEAHLLATAPLLFDALQMGDYSQEEWKEMEKLEAKALGQELLVRMLEDAK